MTITIEFRIFWTINRASGIPSRFSGILGHAQSEDYRLCARPCLSQPFGILTPDPRTEYGISSSAQPRWSDPWPWHFDKEAFESRARLSPPSLFFLTQLLKASHIQRNGRK